MSSPARGHRRRGRRVVPGSLWALSTVFDNLGIGLADYGVLQLFDCLEIACIVVFIGSLVAKEEMQNTGVAWERNALKYSFPVGMGGNGKGFSAMVCRHNQLAQICCREEWPQQGRFRFQPL